MSKEDRPSRLPAGPLLRALLFSVLSLTAAGCASGPSPTDGALRARSTATSDEPSVVLWWSAYSDDLTNITHVVNDVWIGDREDPGDRDARKHQAAWLERGIVPLDWAGGRVYVDEGAEGLANRWSGQLNSGYLGIAIDEFGTRDRDVDRMLAQALVETRRRHPDAIIAVWHGGLIHGGVAEAYRDAVDYVLLEAYVGGASLMGLKLGPRLNNVRRYGLEKKTVVAISLGEERFAATEEDVAAQLQWLRRNTGDFAGIGFYASGASEPLARYADELYGELW